MEEESSMVHFIGYIIVGALIGLMSGLFGIGGSSICTPALEMFFPLPALIALASPLPVTIPTAVAGTYNYARKGLVRKDVVLWTTIGGLPGVVLGALGTRIVSGHWLMILTGLFLSISGVQLIRKGKTPRPGSFSPKRFKAVALLIGFAVGIFSGLLANGGGFVLIPAFILLLGLTPFEATSSSLVCVSLFAIPGTLVHWWLGHIDWRLVLGLSIGVLPTSYLGSRWGLTIGEQRIRIGFGYFMTAFGLDFILTQLGLKPLIADSVLLTAVAVTVTWVLLGISEGEKQGTP
jgi:uncharacterized membrane protein YfcA